MVTVGAISSMLNISYDYSQSKFSFTIKTIDLGSNLKVSTGIKKKKWEENFFSFGWWTRKCALVDAPFLCLLPKSFVCSDITFKQVELESPTTSQLKDIFKGLPTFIYFLIFQNSQGKLCCKTLVSCFFSLWLIGTLHQFSIRYANSVRTAMVATWAIFFV